MNARAVLTSAATSQPVRFVATGIWNTVFGYAVFVAVLRVVPVVGGSEAARSAIAVALSNVIAVPQAYVAYKLFVFKTQGGWRRELPRFVLSNTAIPAANVLLLPLMVRFAPIGPLVHAADVTLSHIGASVLVERATVAQAMLTLVLAACSYFLHKHFSFRPPKTGADLVL